MLTLLKKDLERYASYAPEYIKNERTTEMIETFANKYCEALDNGDEYSKNVYYSCLLLKFWDRITNLYAGQDKHYGEQIRFLIANDKITLEDIFHKVCECIDTAFRYRTWKKPEKKTTAQACINQIISTRAAGELLRPFNLKKNQGEVYVRSLDESIDGDEGKLTLGDTITDTNLNYSDERQAAMDIVQAAINENKIVEAIIFDNMAFTECIKHEKEDVVIIDEETGEETVESRQISSFWAYKLVQELNDLSDSYRKYFLNTYFVAEDKLNAALESLKKANNSKKHRMIESAQNFGKLLLA